MKISRSLKLLSWPVLVFLVQSVAGCSSGNLGNSSDITDDSDVDVVRQPAVIVSGLNLWSSFPIHVCFVRAGTGTTQLTTAQYTTQKANAMRVLNDNWGSVPGISFTNVGDCPLDSNGNLIGGLGNLSVKLWLSGPATCGIGAGAVCEFGLAPDTIMVHEFGHGLGFSHEHQRDVPSTSCTSQVQQLNVCQKCKSDFLATGTCSIADYNACVIPGPAVSGAPLVLSAACPPPDANAVCKDSSNHLNCPKCLPTLLDEVNSVIGDQGTLANQIQLTRFDPVSVMNYCQVLNGRDANNAAPSSLDRLGLEILYPATPTGHGLGCARGCFTFGKDVIVRSDGILSSDFTQRGALGVVPKWHISGTPILELLDAWRINSGTLAYHYGDWNGRLHTGSGTVTKSDATHTAILESPIQSIWL